MTDEKKSLGERQADGLPPGTNDPLAAIERFAAGKAHANAERNQRPGWCWCCMEPWPCKDVLWDYIAAPERRPEADAPSTNGDIGRQLHGAYQYQVGKWRFEHGERWMSAEEIDAMWDRIAASVFPSQPPASGSGGAP